LPGDHRGLAKIDYPSTDLLIASFYDTYLFRSTNKGESWDTLYFKEIGIITATYMYDNKMGLGVGVDDSIKRSKRLYHRTSDGGLSWKLMKEPPDGIELSYINDIQFVEPNLLVGVNPYYGSFKTIWIEGDWDSYSIDTAYLQEGYSISDVDFINRKIGYACGRAKINDLNNRQVIWKTEDGGKTWKIQRDKFYDAYSLRDIEFLDENFGMACGGDKAVLVTTDGGKNWLESFVSDKDILGGLVDLEVISNTCAYVCRTPEGIYKYTNEVISVDDELPKSFSISPNPAEEYIEISGLNKGLQPLVHGQEIKIYNLLGECVLSSPIHPMSSRHRMYIESLPPGIYFIRLGDFVGRFLKI
jgi:hypothetical protein